MNASINALERAKREAEARLKWAQDQGKSAGYKLSSIRHEIRDFEQGLQVLRTALEARLVFVRLWNLVEEGNRNNVQVSGSTKSKRRQRNNGAK